MSNPQQIPNRPNDSSELDHFKRSVDLTAYAVGQHNYQVKEESRRGEWQKLTKEGETLIVTRKGDHQVYMNPGDDRDAGSIIDFVKSRGGAYGEGLNLGQTRQTLRTYLNEDGPQRDQKVLEEAPKPTRIRSVEELAQGLSDEQRRALLIADALGVQPRLESRSYLHSRGISNETIDAPAFQGRVFTARGAHQNTAFPIYNEQGIVSVEEKNTNFKHLLPLPKDGIWVSKPTQPGRPVERVSVHESAIDALSKYQLDHAGGQAQPNTLYVATAGTVTESQTELLQRLLDRQQPREVVLGQDNDGGGRRFTINYLNDLQPPRAHQPGSQHELPAPEQAAPPISWHASTSGRYSTNMKVEFNTDKAYQGREAVADLAQRVARLNGAINDRDQPPLSMDVVRTGSHQTVVRISALNADMPALDLLTRELHAQREARLRQQEPARNASFLRVEYPSSKDFTRDLELTRQGLSGNALAEQGKLEVLHKEEMTRQKNLLDQAAQQARDEEKRQLAEQQRRQQQERQANTPEAQKRREAEDKALGQALVGMAVADALTPARQQEPLPRQQVESANVRTGINQHGELVQQLAGPTGRLGSSLGAEPADDSSREAYKQFVGAYPVVFQALREEGKGQAAGNLAQVVEAVEKGQPLAGHELATLDKIFAATAGNERLRNLPELQQLRGASQALAEVDARPAGAVVTQQPAGSRVFDRPEGPPLRGQESLTELGRLASQLNEPLTRQAVIEIRETPALPETVLSGAGSEKASSYYANKVWDALEMQGAQVRNSEWPERDLPTSGLETTRLTFTYHLEDERQPQLHALLTRLDQQPNIVVRDAAAPEREQAAAGRPAVLVELPVADRPWHVGQAVVLSTDRQAYEQLGARTEAGQNQDGQAVLLVKYSLDQPEVTARVSRALDAELDRQYTDTAGVGAGVQRAGISYESPALQAVRQRVADEQLGPEQLRGVIVVQEPLDGRDHAAYATQLQAALVGYGAQAQLTPGQAGGNWAATNAGLVENRVSFSLPVGSEREPAFVNMLDTLTSQPGIKLEKLEPLHVVASFDDRYPPGNMPAENVPGRAQPLLERQAVLHLLGEEKLPVAEQLRPRFEELGAQVGPVAVGEPIAGSKTYSVPIIYQLDSDRISELHSAFKAVTSEYRADSDVRLAGSVNVAQQHHHAGQAIANQPPLPALAPEAQAQPGTVETGPLRAPAYELVQQEYRRPEMQHPFRYTEVVIADGPESATKMQQLARQMEQVGATPGAITEGHNFQHATLNIMVGYRIDQPELPEVAASLQALAADKAVLVKDYSGQFAERRIELDRREREPDLSYEQSWKLKLDRYEAQEAARTPARTPAQQQPTPASAPAAAVAFSTSTAEAADARRAPLYSEATDQQRQADINHPVRYVQLSVVDQGYNEDALRVLRKQLAETGATVDEIRPVAGVADQPRLALMVGYRLDQPELPQIQQQLLDARSQDTVSLREQGGQLMERIRAAENPEQARQRYSQLAEPARHMADGPAQPTPSAAPVQQAEAEQSQHESRRLRDRADDNQQVADTRQADPHPAEAAPERAAADNGTSQLARITVIDKPEAGQQQVPNKKAEAISDAFEAAGATAGEPKSVTGQNGERRTEFEVSYRTDAATIGEIDHTFKRAGASSGVEVQETGEARSLRQQAVERSQPQSTRQQAEIER